MSGPYHERAVCPCGWTASCASGNLHLLTFQGQFVNVCPNCGGPKGDMAVRVLRWHDRTWRHIDGRPYDGVEPELEPLAISITERWWFAPLVITSFLAAAAMIVNAFAERLT